MPKMKSLYRVFVYGRVTGKQYNDSDDLTEYLIDVIDFNDKRSAEAFCNRTIKQSVKGIEYKRLNHRGEVVFIELKYGKPDYNSKCEYAMKEVEYIINYNNFNGQIEIDTDYLKD